jgi:hypothetical protein
VLAKLRHYRPSHTTVVAYLALFVALGGTSFAAVRLSKNSVRSKHIKNEQVRSVDVKNASLLSQDFAPGQLPTGEQGPQGERGQDGQNGTNGLNGSPAASALTGHVSGHVLGPETKYAEPHGKSAPTDDEFDVVHLSPNASVVARDLRVKAVVIGLNTTGSVTFTLRDDGADTPVACTIPIPDTDGAPGVDDTCNSGGASATIAPGSELSLKVTVTGADVKTERPRFGWRATTP